MKKKNTFAFDFSDNDTPAKDKQRLVERTSVNRPGGLRPRQLREGGGAQSRAEDSEETSEGAGAREGDEDGHEAREEVGAEERQVEGARIQETAKNSLR